MEEYRKIAAVTGASSGIGYHLAMEFAEHGYDVIICAENESIHHVAAKIKEHGNKVIPVQADLSQPEGVETFYRAITEVGTPLDALAINAGVGVGGASFDKTDLQREISMINLNVISAVHLTKLVLKDMLSRGEGKILFTSSIAAEMPGPYYSVYAATKSFIQSFAEAIRQEVKDKGIIVTSLQPGATDTDFFRRADMLDTKAGEGKKDDPAEVAKQGFEALMSDKDSIVAGSFSNKIQAGMAKVTPQALGAKMQGSSTKPNSPEKR